MSKYTTETRYVCESLAGFKESVDANLVDDVLSKSWNKVFTTDFETFDPSYKQVLCKKILKHYWVNEIGMETLGLWKLALNTKFEEIMPFYNLLYKAEELKFNPLEDTNITTTNSSTGSTNANLTQNNTRTSTANKTGNVTVDDSKIYGGNDSTTVTSKNNGSSDTVATNARTDLYSDTPQGSLSGVSSNAYLTNARQINDDGNTNTTTNDSGSEDTTHTRNLTDTGSSTTTNNLTDTVNDESSNTKEENIKNTEEWIQKTIGKSQGVSFSTLLIEYRQAMINIDMLVIEEFADCFMGLW